MYFTLLASIITISCPCKGKISCLCNYVESGLIESNVLLKSGGILFEDGRFFNVVDAFGKCLNLTHCVPI